MSTHRLLLDVMCGGLRSYLRMCGHDTVYALDRGIEADDRLLAIAREEDRTLITRDRRLATRADTAILLETTDTESQLRALYNAGIELTLVEPTRCSRCNGRLEPAIGPRPEYAPPERPAWQCVDCGQWFWKGSHWNRVRATLQSV